MTTTYQTPQVPHSITDAVNRAAAATGSLRSAEASTHASYMGHCVRISKGLRNWGVSYRWAGTRWIARGVATLEEALKIATARSEAKARGGLVEVTFFSDEPSSEDLETLSSFGLLPREEAEAVDASWKDGRFTARCRGGASTPHVALGLDKGRSCYASQDGVGRGLAVATLLALPAGLSSKEAQDAIFKAVRDQSTRFTTTTKKASL